MEEVEDIKGGFNTGFGAAVKAVLEGLTKDNRVSIWIEIVIWVLRRKVTLGTCKDLVRIFFIKLIDFVSIPLD